MIYSITFHTHTHVSNPRMSELCGFLQSINDNSSEIFLVYSGTGLAVCFYVFEKIFSIA